MSSGDIGLFDEAVDRFPRGTLCGVSGVCSLIRFVGRSVDEGPYSSGTELMSLLAIELLEDVLELLEDLLELSGAMADNLWIESFGVCMRKVSQTLASTPWTDCHALRADGTSRRSRKDVLSQANLPGAPRAAAPNRGLTLC